MDGRGGANGLKEAFELDSRNTGTWKVYDGWVPYGPWTLNHNWGLVEVEVDGVKKKGGRGTWDPHWAAYSNYPNMEFWPGHEQYNNNIHAPLSAENTVHQNAVYAGLTYGYANERHQLNATSKKSIKNITLDCQEMQLQKDEQMVMNIHFDLPNPSCPAHVWTAQNPEIAHVDRFGRVTALRSGKTKIVCKTLDGSVSAEYKVTIKSSPITTKTTKTTEKIN